MNPSSMPKGGGMPGAGGGMPGAGGMAGKGGSLPGAGGGMPGLSGGMPGAGGTMKKPNLSEPKPDTLNAGNKNSLSSSNMKSINDPMANLNEGQQKGEKSEGQQNGEGEMSSAQKLTQATGRAAAAYFGVDGNTADAITNSKAGELVSKRIEDDKIANTLAKKLDEDGALDAVGDGLGAFQKVQDGDIKGAIKDAKKAKKGYDKFQRKLRRKVIFLVAPPVIFMFVFIALILGAAGEQLVPPSETHAFDQDRQDENSNGGGLIPEGEYNMVSPLTTGTTTSCVGLRDDPVNGTPNTQHNGMDIGAPLGTAIYATLDGTVITATSNSSRGNYVELSHGDITSSAGNTINNVTSLYQHMQKYVVSVGDQVTAGQLIGYVGSTGKSTGAHLHWEMKVNGTLTDPALLITKPSYINDAE